MLVLATQFIVLYFTLFDFQHNNSVGWECVRSNDYSYGYSTLPFKSFSKEILRNKMEKFLHNNYKSYKRKSMPLHSDSVEYFNYKFSNLSDSFSNLSDKFSRLRVNYPLNTTQKPFH